MYMMGLSFYFYHNHHLKTCVSAKSSFIHSFIQFKIYSTILEFQRAVSLQFLLFICLYTYVCVFVFWTIVCIVCIPFHSYIISLNSFVIQNTDIPKIGTIGRFSFTNHHDEQSQTRCTYTLTNTQKYNMIIDHEQWIVDKYDDEQKFLHSSSCHSGSHPIQERKKEKKLE